MIGSTELEDSMSTTNARAAVAKSTEPAAATWKGIQTAKVRLTSKSARLPWTTTGDAVGASPASPFALSCSALVR